jgi:drug/metabolite transporter (DMT)-like permease
MLRGVLFLGVAAVFFALTSVFAKLATAQGVSGMEANFARFFMGFLLAGGYILYYKKSIRPNNWQSVIGRSFFNILSASFFFLSIQHTTITNANMLNMTSPVYIFLLVPFFEPDQQRSLRQFIFLAFTILGVYLIVGADFTQVNIGDVYGALSGLFGGIAISVLHQARKYDDAYVILFYQMGIGSLTIFLVTMPTFAYHDSAVWWYIILAGLMGALGQVLLTIGYRYIDAATGSIVSSSQMLFATVFGIVLFNDPLNWRVSVGGILILISLVGVSRFWRSERVRRLFIYDQFSNFNY